jgi:hypothetical protein
MVQRCIYEPYYSTPVGCMLPFGPIIIVPMFPNWYWVLSYLLYCLSPYPVFECRNNISISKLFYNTYNYVNVRSSSRAVVYNSRDQMYERRQHPNYSFSRKKRGLNRYELDQRRGTRSNSNFSRNGNDTNRNSIRRTGRDDSNNNGQTSRSTVL